MKRNLVLKIHGSLGILMGLLLLVISLTGSAIVFHKELDHSLNRSLWFVTPQVEQVSLDAIASTVQTAFPELPVQSIQLPQQSSESYVVGMQTTNGRSLQTFVNPYTGAILGSRLWEYSLVGFLYTLHHDLFAGNVGLVLVGITGVGLLLMAITGTLLWTGWRKLATGFKIRWQSPRPLLSYDLHKVSGIISTVFLLITSFTGVVIIFFHLLPVFSAAPATKPEPVPQQSPLALSALLRKADAAMPDGKTTFVTLLEGQPKIIVTKRLPNQETGEIDFSTVELNRYTGEVLLVNKVVKPIPFFKFLLTIASLHFGTFGGVSTRILYVFVGLMPTVLLVTGLVLWKRRRWLKARKNEAIALTQHSTENLT